MLRRIQYLPIVAVAALLVLSACDSNEDDSVAGVYTLVSFTTPEEVLPGSSVFTITAGQPFVGEIGGFQITFTVSGMLTFTEGGTFQMDVLSTQGTSAGSFSESTEISGLYSEDGGTGTMTTEDRMLTFSVSGERVTVVQPDVNTTIIFDRE